MANEAKQRFLDLDVGEISLVDSPANEQEFIVVKRLTKEDGDMAENTEIMKNDAGVSEPLANNSAPEKVQVEVEKATNEAVEKAMAQVTTLVENIAKAAEAEKQDVNKSGDETSTDTNPDSDVEKGKKPDMRGMYKAQLEKAGVKGESLEKAMNEFDKKLGGFKPGKDTQPPIKKSDDADVEKSNTDDAEEETQKALVALEKAIQKAKTFTPKREAALKAAIETLTGLMKELMPKDIPQNTSPATTVPESPKYGESSVVDLTKMMGELKEVLTGKLSEVQDVAKGLTERLETIEKTRNPSTSVEDEGGTDTNEVKKSFWANVL